MPKKHLRRDSDIEQLGREFAGRWQRADGIEPWLRSIEAELSRKVRSERWSWEGIARALNVAGIVYETGRPWTGPSLAQKIMSIRYEARHPVGRTKQSPPGRCSNPAPGSSLPTTAPPQEATQEAPEFRPASLKGWSGTRIVRRSEPPSDGTPASAQLSFNETSAVIARLLGKT